MKRLWAVSTIALFGIMTLATVASAKPQNDTNGFAGCGGSWEFPQFHNQGEFSPTYQGGEDGVQVFLSSTSDLPLFTLDRICNMPASMTGEVVIDESPVSGALVYVDGQYMGRANKVKDLRLSAGIHTIELIRQNTTVYHGDLDIGARTRTEIQFNQESAVLNMAPVAKHVHTSSSIKSGANVNAGTSSDVELFREYTASETSVSEGTD